MSAQVDPARVIGVGMGGSCPDCRGPLDLGQHYCLECGSNVHAKKRVRRLTAVPGTAPAAAASPARGGFPWVWFAVVMVLAVGGLVSVLAYESSGSSTKHAATDHPTADTTEGVSSTPASAADGQNAVPTTPSFPTTTSVTTTPGTAGAVGDTNPAAGGIPTTPAVTTPAVTTPAVTTPAATPVKPVTATPAAVTTPAHTTPAVTTPAAVSTTPVVATTPAATTPVASAPATPASNATTNPTTWPAGTIGWTVVLGSYGKSLYTQADAQQRATQAQTHGETAGVLDSDLYGSLTPGYWEVFAGDYTTQALAQAHVAAAVTAGYASAYVRQIKA